MKLVKNTVSTILCNGRDGGSGTHRQAVTLLPLAGTVGSSPTPPTNKEFMQLREALEESDIQAAKRPYYNDPEMMKIKDMAKYIVIQDGFDIDAYVVYGDTGKFYKNLEPFEVQKIRGKNDWEPVIRGE